MQYREFLYAKLAEEAGEIAQMAIKTSLFGENNKDPSKPDSDTNAQALGKELNDLLTVFALLNKLDQPSASEDDIIYDVSDEHIEMKMQKLKQQFSEISQLRVKGKV
jgi:NTP pyrophosphatase (non-canonical NTP hydrolase)